MAPRVACDVAHIVIHLGLGTEDVRVGLLGLLACWPVLCVSMSVSIDMLPYIAIASPI